MNDENIALKPCPFCGGKAVFKIYGTEKEMSSVGYSYHIECSKCGMTNMSCRGKIMLLLHPSGEVKIVEDDRNKSADGWNRRFCNAL